MKHVVKFGHASTFQTRFVWRIVWNKQTLYPHCFSTLRNIPEERMSHNAIFEALTAVLLTVQVHCDITICCSVFSDVSKDRNAAIFRVKRSSQNTWISVLIIYIAIHRVSRSQWPRCVRRGSAAARLLGLRVRIPHRAWMSVSCECCVLSGRGHCDELITRPEESYRVWCVYKVWSWSLEKKKWGGLGPQGAVEPLGGKKFLV
jgi:hypothetical protein